MLSIISMKEGEKGSKEEGAFSLLFFSKNGASSRRSECVFPPVVVASLLLSSML